MLRYTSKPHQCCHLQLQLAKTHQVLLLLLSNRRLLQPPSLAGLLLQPTLDLWSTLIQNTSVTWIANFWVTLLLPPHLHVLQAAVATITPELVTLAIVQGVSYILCSSLSDVFSSVGQVLPTDLPPVWELGLEDFYYIVQIGVAPGIYKGYKEASCHIGSSCSAVLHHFAHKNVAEQKFAAMLSAGEIFQSVA